MKHHSIRNHAGHAKSNSQHEIELFSEGLTRIAAAILVNISNQETYDVTDSNLDPDFKKKHSISHLDFIYSNIALSTNAKSKSLTMYSISSDSKLLALDLASYSLSKDGGDMASFKEKAESVHNFMQYACEAIVGQDDYIRTYSDRGGVVSFEKYKTYYKKSTEKLINGLLDYVVNECQDPEIKKSLTIYCSKVGGLQEKREAGEELPFVDTIRSHSTLNEKYQENVVSLALGRTEYQGSSSIAGVLSGSKVSTPEREKKVVRFQDSSELLDSKPTVSESVYGEDVEGKDPPPAITPSSSSAAFPAITPEHNI